METGVLSYAKHHSAQGFLFLVILTIPSRAIRFQTVQFKTFFNSFRTIWNIRNIVTREVLTNCLYVKVGEASNLTNLQIYHVTKHTTKNSVFQTLVANFKTFVNVSHISLFKDATKHCRIVPTSTMDGEEVDKQHHCQPISSTCQSTNFQEDRRQC